MDNEFLSKQTDGLYAKFETNKGNIYSSDGSLLATSIPNYNIRFDAVAPKDIAFEKNVQPLADSLAKILGKPSSFYHTQLRMARANKNRYLLIASDLSYSEYIKIKGFPLEKIKIIALYLEF